MYNHNQLLSIIKTERRDNKRSVSGCLRPRTRSGVTCVNSFMYVKAEIKFKLKIYSSGHVAKPMGLRAKIKYKPTTHTIGQCSKLSLADNRRTFGSRILIQTKFARTVNIWLVIPKSFLRFLRHFFQDGRPVLVICLSPH